MTRPIGEIFEDEGVKLEVKESGNCYNCYYQSNSCHNKTTMRTRGLCTSCDRSDNTSVKFMEVNDAEGK